MRRIGIACALAALVLGNLNALGDWLATYAGRPNAALYETYVHASSILTVLAVCAFAYALVRSSAPSRRRIGVIAAAFAFAGIARLVSDAAFPQHLTPWQNGLLLSTTVLPIGAVWFSVLRHRYFKIDFVVGRAIVYVSLTAAVVGTITLAEEIGTYVFYQNTDLANGFLVVISTIVGMGTGKTREFIEKIVDGFVFRDRHDRRAALGLISGYILDAENADDVYRALLDDVTHALSLSFSGVLVRDSSGSFVLERESKWPHDMARTLPASDELVRGISSARSIFEFGGKKRTRDRVSRERATALHPEFSLAAPLFADRRLVAVVVYGRNVSGLNLDSEERERLTRLVAHASLALASIELARAREGLVSHALIPIETRAPERVGE